MTISKLTMQKVQLQVVAARVLDMLRFLTDGTKVKLHMHIEDDLPAVYGDEERLIQIVINLVHNALKYTEEGTVELTAEHRNEEVWIHVRDTGAGMDEELQKRVFMPYEQGASGEGGIGLGLSVCKSLVELHGSELNLQSQPGVGSVFSFKLPVMEQPSVLSSSIAPANEAEDSQASAAAAKAAAGYSVKEMQPIPQLPATAERIRVLVVDDDPVNLKVLIHILSNESYYIETAYSASEALDKLHKEQWDLIISDVMMPGMSGYELTRRIRERFTSYELPIMLLTARSAPEDVYAGFQAGANDYVTKPVDAMELQHRAEALAALKHAVNERLRMEAAYLQAQIHPHFLFNTLNSILALSDMDTDKMRELADALTSYLRISFNFLAAGNLVALARELELVENYLYIEQQRFPDRLQVEWLVNADTEVLIPPLAIQPLVENAIRHGILSLARGGTLRIRIEQQADTVMCAVEDTGKGMNEEQIRKLLSSTGETKRGIGLLNTHSRLTRLYGQGLRIQSVPGEGTTVSFTVPVRKKE